MTDGGTLVDLIISLGSVSITSVLIFVLYRICKTKSNCTTNVGGFNITVSNTSTPVAKNTTTTSTGTTLTHADEVGELRIIHVREHGVRNSVTDEQFHSHPSRDETPVRNRPTRTDESTETTPPSNSKS